MPTLFILLGYRFFFWSNDHESILIHVSKGDSEAKYNVVEVELVENFGFKKNEGQWHSSVAGGYPNNLLKRYMIG